MIFSNSKKFPIHFVGIGGAGMGGIAEVLLSLGYPVTGSDISENTVTQHLRKLGAHIEIGHDPAHVNNAHVVVCSTAITQDNPEILAAKEQYIPVIPRAEMLAELMRFKHGIAIAGTHGKTTTTSLVTAIFTAAGLDPTFLIGGRLNSAGTNANLGKGDYLIAEADESDASFLYLQPMLAVVTNIDSDHMATYDYDFEQLKQTFVNFLHRLPFYGRAVLCIDDPVVRSILDQVSRPQYTYGFNEGADFQGFDYEQKGLVSHFKVKREGKKNLEIALNLPGKHNALNALAAIAIAAECGVSDEAIVNSLQQFQGIGRRFQIRGEFDVNDGSITLLDDYGHHPREVSVTIDAIRNAWPDRRLVMVFQPHRYSRTSDLMDEFVDALAKSDELFLLNIYSAGETALEGISSQALGEKLKACSNLQPIVIEKHQDLPKTLSDKCKDGDIVVMQGAGDIGRLAENLASSQLQAV